jgi:hypothetical protein
MNCLPTSFSAERDVLDFTAAQQVIDLLRGEVDLEDLLDDSFDEDAFDEPICLTFYATR